MSQSQSIESFVARLQAEGVEAGRQQAQKLIDQARAEAERVLADAKRQAEQIVADANRIGESTLERARTELALATRDAVLALGQTLNRVLNAVLSAGVAEALNDESVLKDVLRELVETYARADIENGDLDIRLNPQMLSRLADWAIAQMRGREKGRLSVELTDGLKGAGFEYTFAGSTVEVTVGSVVELLSGMVTPKLAEVIRQATEK